MSKKTLTSILLSTLLSLNLSASNLYSSNSNSYTSKSYIEERTFYFGNNKVNASKYVVPGKNKITYINVHENEWTSITVGKNKILKDGGIFYLLKHEKTRRIRGSRANFDPNRMFTKNGLFHNVNRHERKEVSHFSKYLINWIFNDTNSIIALHNNTHGGYGIKYYLPSGKLHKDATRVNYNPKLNPDNFFFTTNNFVYESLVSKKYNVVLQSPGASDDGSLSVYADRNNIDYINVECAFGESKIQAKMVDDATDILYVLNNGLYLK